jgi:hypothetical protein
MEQKSILDSVSEHDVVTVFNPLSDAFIGKVARSVVSSAARQSVQTGNGEADAFVQGLNRGISNGGHLSMAHVQQQVVLKPGQSVRMPGDIARVIVRQLVKEMMQREGAKRQMADPATFMEYEQRVVLNHENMLSNLSLESVEERLQRQLDDLNKIPEVAKDVENEQAFPTEQPSSDTGAVARDGEKPVTAARKSPGRPREQAN